MEHSDFWVRLQGQRERLVKLVRLLAGPDSSVSAWLEMQMVISELPEEFLANWIRVAGGANLERFREAREEALWFLICESMASEEGGEG